MKSALEIQPSLLQMRERRHRIKIQVNWQVKSGVGFCADCLLCFTLPYSATHKNQLTDVDLTLFKKSLELNSGRAALQERTNTKK